MQHCCARLHTNQDLSGNFQELRAKSNAHRCVALYIPTVLFWSTLCCFCMPLAFFVGRFSPGIQRSCPPGLCLCAPSSIALSAPKQCLLCLVSLMPQPRERSEYWFYIAIVKMHRISRRLDLLRPDRHIWDWTCLLATQDVLRRSCNERFCVVHSRGVAQDFLFVNADSCWIIPVSLSQKSFFFFLLFDRACYSIHDWVTEGKELARCCIRWQILVCESDHKPCLGGFHPSDTNLHSIWYLCMFNESSRLLAFLFSKWMQWSQTQRISHIFYGCVFVPLFFWVFLFEPLSITVLCE